MATVTIVKGELIVDGKRIVFPRDANIDHAPPLIGLAPDGSFKPILIDEDGKLVIDFEESEITIGAVEVKDGNSNVRLDIVSDGQTVGVDHFRGVLVFGKDDNDTVREIPIVDLGSGDFAVRTITTLAPGPEGDSIMEFGSVTTIAPNSQSTVLSISTGLQMLYLDGFVVTGSIDAEFTLHIATAEKIAVRTAGADRTETVMFPVTQKIPASTTVDIKVTHWYKSTADFKATLIGHR